MRTWGFFVLLVISGCGQAVRGQNSAAQQQIPVQRPADPKDAKRDTEPNEIEPALTPVQEREKQIREFDPLNPSDEDQKQKTKADREVDRRREQEQAPAPGSIAATERNSAARPNGPQVIEEDSAETPVQEYSGPAVLSRSYSVNRPLIPQQLRWQESAGLNAVYDTGIISGIASPGGTAGSGGAIVGTELTWSFAGRKYVRHDQIGVRFGGNASHYSGGQYGGMNNSITMDYTHVLSRRLSVTLSGTGSIFSQNYALENPSIGPETSIANINLSSSPNIQIFDTGTKQFSAQADVTWHKSSRLSFNLGLADFGISRNAPGLLGVSGRQASGDVNYRLTRKTTIGASYSFSWYLYPRGFGNSDINTAGLIYSYAISRSVQVRMRVGLSRVESLGLQTVPIDPSIALLIGTHAGVIDAYRTSRNTDISAQLVKDFRGGRTASIAYAQGVSPGNGLFQTSRQETISATLSTKLFRTYSLQLALGRDSLSALTQALAEYQSENARISLSRALRRHISWSFSADFRHFDAGDITPVRNQARISSGLTWSPAEGRLWPF
jgi:hypothetical protein